MMHNVAGKSLQRNTAHRRALRKNFPVSAITPHRVVTTLPKAKALRPFVEKMITLARSNDAKTRLHRIRRAVALLQDKTAVKKLRPDLSPLTQPVMVAWQGETLTHYAWSFSVGNGKAEDPVRFKVFVDAADDIRRLKRLTAARAVGFSMRQLKALSGALSNRDDRS